MKRELERERRRERWREKGCKLRRITALMEAIL